MYIYIYFLNNDLIILRSVVLRGLPYRSRGALVTKWSIVTVNKELFSNKKHF